jgi:hypothetical protein
VPEIENFVSQLAARDRVFDVRPRLALSPQRRTGRTLRAPASRPLPSVLLLSRSCDAELDSVQDLLARAAVPVARVNSDELAEANLLIDPTNKTILLNGRWMAPTATWLRHFSVQAIDGGSIGPAPELFLRSSWHATADQLTAISGISILPRRPPLLAQLMLAQRNQIAVPRTIVTTDLGHARQAFSCPRLVIKAVDEHFVEAEPGRLTGIFPTVVERRALPDGPGPPVVVQEYVEHDAELRVYYAAGRITAYEVGKDSPADPWTDPHGVRVRPVESPAAVETATRLLASAMALRFGAFDFLLRGGAPVFLEVNPDGDWRWAERRSHTTLVSLAAARMLTELHHETRQAMPRTVDHGIKPLNLLAFLSRPSRRVVLAPTAPGPGAWLFSRAIGFDERIDERLAMLTYPLCERLIQAPATRAFFAPPPGTLPSTATPQDRLLHLAGREP